MAHDRKAEIRGVSSFESKPKEGYGEHGCRSNAAVGTSSSMGFLFHTLPGGSLLHDRPCIECWDSEMIDPGLLKEPSAGMGMNQ